MNQRILVFLSAVILISAPLSANALQGENSSHQGASPQSHSHSNGPETYVVVLRDEAPYFNPKRLRIPHGGTVTWENRGPVLIHTIHVNTVKGVMRSGSIGPGQTWSFRFNDADDAVIRTTCEVHPYMYGLVIVGDPPDSMISAMETNVESHKGDRPGARILEFPLPVKDSVPGILAIDSEDNVWFTMGGGGLASIELPSLNMVGRLTIDGDIRIYSLPTKASTPNGLITGSDGAVFITQYFGNKVTRLDPRRRAIEEYSIPTPDSQPTGLALDAEGNLWFNENKGNKIGRLSASGDISEFHIPTPNSRPTGMVIDHQGNIWFAERDTSKIGCLRRDGSFVEYNIPTPKAKPAGMAIDAQGRIWFAERNGNKIGVLENGRIREYPLPNPDSGPFFPIIDGDGQVWFTELFGNRIGKLDPASGKITEYDLPTKNSMPGGLGIDSQGNIWFSMQLGNKIGVILRSPNPRDSVTHNHQQPSEKELKGEQ